MIADLRSLASTDIDEAVAYYRGEAGTQVALDFVDALEAAISHLLRHPLTGSLQFSYELEIPELRSWPLENFPYIVFYLPDADRLDIWRVLHARRNIPAYLISDTPD